MNVLSSILSKRVGCCRAAALSFLAVLPLQASVPSRVPAGFGQIPLHFEENLGQAGEGIDFTARGNGYGVALTPAGADIGLRGNKGESPTVIRMRLSGEVSKSNAQAVDKLPGVVNYRVGKDQSRWRNGIETYSKVRYPEVYSGVDLVYYGNQRQLQYDFIVAPGGDPGVIGWKIDGVERLAISKDGELVLGLKKGELVMKKPFIYQADGESVKAIEGGFKITDGTVGFEVGSYDKTKSLVIDPVLEYSTYLGGDIHDGAKAVAVDSQGNVYVVGCTYSTTFPTTNTSSNQGIGDAFISKLNPTGTALLFSTYFGGDGFDYASGVAVDSVRNLLYVTGETYSSTYLSTTGSSSAPDMFVGSVPLGTVAVYADSPVGTTTVSVVSGTANPTKYSVSQSGGFTLSRTGDISKNLDIDLEMTVFLSDGTQTVTKRRAGIPAGFKSKTWAANVSIKNNGSENPVYTTESRVKIVADTEGSDYNIDAHDTASIFFRATFPGSGSVTFPSAAAGAILSISAVEPTVGEIPGKIADGYPQAAMFRVFRSGDISTSVRFAVNFNASTSPGNATESVDYHAFIRNYDLAGNPTDIPYTGGDPISMRVGVSHVDLVIVPEQDEDQERTEPVVALLSSVTDSVWVGEETIRLIDTNGGDSEGFLVRINALSGSPEYILQFGGGGIDIPNAVTVDLAGNVYVAGETYSWNFPSTGNAVQVFPPSAPIASDAFVLKLSGTNVKYSTLYGGDGQDAGLGIAADSTGAAYITGFTASKGVSAGGLTVKSPFPAYPMNSAIQSNNAGGYDAFVAKIDSLGRALLYSTFLGGSAYDAGRAIALDLVGNAYVTGETRSKSGSETVQTGVNSSAGVTYLPFPTRNAFQTYNSIPPNPTDGSVGASLAADSLSNAFVTKINPIGTMLIYSTYLGGSSNDYANGIAVDIQGNAYVTGYSESPDLPTPVAFSLSGVTTTSGGLFPRNLDAFIAVLQPDGSRIRSTTYIGGDGPDFGFGMALNKVQPLKPEAILVGETYSDTFPTHNALQPYRESAPTGFVSKISFPQPDLAISGTFIATTGTARVGDELTYKITVTNTSAFTASGVRVNQTLPATVEYVGSNSSYVTPRTDNPSLLEADMGLIASGTSKTYRIIVRPTAPGFMSSTVSVRSDSYDPVPGNNFKQISFTAEPENVIVSVVGGGATHENKDYNWMTFNVSFSGTSTPGIIPFTFSRSGSTDLPLIVNYSLGGTATAGTDYTAVSLGQAASGGDQTEFGGAYTILGAPTGRIIIPAGKSSATLMIASLPDTVAEGLETAVLKITDGTYSVGTASSATLRIDDGQASGGGGLPSLAIIATSASTAENSQTPLQFTVTRSGATTDSLTVRYQVGGTAKNGVDYSALSGAILIPAGQNQAVIAVTPIDDTFAEGPENVKLTLLSSSAYRLSTSIVAKGKIVDDEPAVSIAVEDGQAHEYKANVGTVRITRTGNLNSAVTVRLNVAGTATNGNDYNLIGSTLLIPAGSSSALLTITPVLQTVREGTESVIISIQANTVYRITGTNSATVLIRDYGEPVW